MSYAHGQCATLQGFEQDKKVAAYRSMGGGKMGDLDPMAYASSATTALASDFDHLSAKAFSSGSSWGGGHVDCLASPFMSQFGETLNLQEKMSGKDMHTMLSDLVRGYKSKDAPTAPKVQQDASQGSFDGLSVSDMANLLLSNISQGKTQQGEQKTPQQQQQQQPQVQPQPQQPPRAAAQQLHQQAMARAPMLQALQEQQHSVFDQPHQQMQLQMQMQRDATQQQMQQRFLHQQQQEQYLQRGQMEKQNHMSMEQEQLQKALRHQKWMEMQQLQQHQKQLQQQQQQQPQHQRQSKPALTQAQYGSSFPQRQQPQGHLEQQQFTSAPPGVDAGLVAAAANADGAADKGMTTVMVRNVPVMYTQEMLIIEWPVELGWDFLYLPRTSVDSANSSYAFLNFRTQELADAFKTTWQKKRLAHFSSQKALNISLAAVQGLEANLQQLKKKCAFRAKISQKCLPIVIREGRRVPSEELMTEIQASAATFQQPSPTSASNAPAGSHNVAGQCRAPPGLEQVYSF